MKKYNLTNIVTGWIVFVVATITYLMTIEPTASFWDCGEFISTAFRLEVGHPPGAPLFMILARFFSLFSFGDVHKVAPLINSLSALMSSFSILFLFWTITHLGRKILTLEKEDKYDLSQSQLVAVMATGIVGALAYTFSDTFWFSAVEGEVYGSSSFFTAIVFWAMLKWENVANEKYANRWLILIAYLMGLSIGVHLLNLLAIPAMVMLYYFKKYKTTPKGVVYASIASVVILGAIQYGIIPYTIKVASWFELFFTNSLGFSYNIGTLVYAFLLTSVLIWGVYFSYKKRKVLLNTILLGVMMILIGYSSYAMIVIRAFADTPIDENDPQNVFALLSYLNREQYGDRPLVKGQYFNAPVSGHEMGKKVYAQVDGKYKVVDQSKEYVYDDKFTTIFPRMYSESGSHISAYKIWANLKDEDLFEPRLDKDGQPMYDSNNNPLYNTQAPKAPPSFGANLSFFFKYQVWHMYFRYFLWNFSGKQNDLQGHGGTIRGNFITGIPFIDDSLYGSQSDLPKSLAQSKAKNKYYMLPLILGLIGMFYMYNKSKKDFTVVMLFFFFTGIAIIIYLNQTPYQPRERDYAYAGSFYVFAIWIGFGVLSIFNALSKKIGENKHTAVAIGTGAILLLAVPVNMAHENWDDHDRSGRYSVRDFAANYLNSCEPNAILFTYGDNDTFPLWYAQEVEGIRTDVRIVNLSLLATDWYIDQMKKRAYKSAPVPFGMAHEKYMQGKREVIPIQDSKEYLDLKDAMKFVSSDEDEAMLTYNEEKYNYIPSNHLKMNIDSAKVVNMKVISKKMAEHIVKTMKWEVTQSYVDKAGMMILDLLATNNWKRPVYFATSVGEENFLGLQKYFRLDGFAYKVIPVETVNDDGETGAIETSILYDNMMNKMKWGRINQPDFYVDEQHMRTLSIMDTRNVFARLAMKLIEEGKRAKAIEVLDRCLEVLPNSKVPFDHTIIPVIEAYYRAAQTDKANELLKQILATTYDNLNYFLKLKGRLAESAEYDTRTNLQILKQLGAVAQTNNQKDLAKEISNRLQMMLQSLQ